MFTTVKEIWANVLGFRMMGDRQAFTREEEIVRARFALNVLTEFDELRFRYTEQFKDEKSRLTALILDTDAAKELCPEYGTSPEGRIRYSVCAYGPAKMFIRRLFKQEAASKRVQIVLFSSGGTASGKSTAMKIWHARGRDVLVVDGTLSDLRTARTQVRYALRKKKIVIIAHVFSPVEIAMRRALDRAVERGRILTIDTFAQTHFKSQRTVFDMDDEFGNHPSFAIRILDRRSEQGSVSDLLFLKSNRYETFIRVLERSKQAFADECERRRLEGSPLPEDIKAAFLRVGRRVG